MSRQVQLNIPVLTEIIAEGNVARSSSETEALIAELQTELASRAFALMEELLRTGLAEMEAALYEQVCTRLRQELPELTDRILREHLARDESEQS